MARIDWNRRQLRGTLDLQATEELEVQQIKEIHICFNFLSEIPPAAFHHFSALTCLSLSCNNLRSIPPLDGRHLPSLRELCLSSNQIAKIENLDCLPDLECLELRCNQIRCIEGLASNGKLTRLTLSGNQIATINWKQVPDFPDLTFLGIYGNQLSNFDDVCKLLSQAPNLREAFVGSNVFSQGQPVSLRSVLLGMAHVEAAEVRTLLSQLSSHRQLEPSTLEGICDGYAKGNGGSRRLSCVIKMLSAMKEACPALVYVDGDPLFFNCGS